jgi:hypothetical protein
MTVVESTKQRCPAVRAAITAVFLLACLSSLNAQEQTGTIVFYREPHAMTGDFKPTLYCDREELARIENGTSFEVTAPVGIHTCTVESLQRPGAIEVNVIAGKPAYVHVKLLQGWKDHAALANTTADEYNKQKAKLKPLKEWNRNALRSTTTAPVEIAKQTAAIDETAPPATSDNDAGAPPKRVFLTRRKSWLASGGFNPNLRAGGSQASDFTNDFHKRCPNLVITEMQGTADYAVTIDEISTWNALTGPSNAPTFQVAVYSRSAGLLYTGGTSFLKNAVKDACNAIGAN